MTLGEALAFGKKELSLYPRSALEAELLLMATLKKDRAHLIINWDKEISPKKINYFKTLTAKRKKGWPSAYLAGQKDFYNLSFTVSPDTLIPRPESELIIESILKENPGAKTIIDVGCGSGCLIITLAKNLKKHNEYFGLDISDQALKIAKLNSKNNKTVKKIIFKKSNLLTALLSKLKKEKQPLVIVANLPYLTPAQFKQEPSIKKEPKLALIGGKDGLKYYRQLFKQLSGLRDQEMKIYCEINPEQIKEIKKIATNNLKIKKTEIVKDYSGKNRIFIATN